MTYNVSATPFDPHQNIFHYRIIMLENRYKNGFSINSMTKKKNSGQKIFGEVKKPETPPP